MQTARTLSGVFSITVKTKTRALTVSLGVLGVIGLIVEGLSYYSDQVGILPIWVFILYSAVLGGIAFSYLFLSKSLHFRAVAITVISILAIGLIVYSNYIYTPLSGHARIPYGLLIGVGICLILDYLVSATYFIPDRKA